MFSSKKAATWTSVIWGLITLAVGIIVVFYLFRGVGTDPVQCPGECVKRENCVWPYVTFSSRCYGEDGSRASLDTVCCVRYDDIDRPPTDLTPIEDPDIEIEFPENEESTVCTIAEFPIQFYNLDVNYRVRCIEGTNNALVCDINANRIIGEKNACEVFPEGTTARNTCCSITETEDETETDETETFVPTSISISQGSERHTPINPSLVVGVERFFYVTTQGSEVANCRVYTINPLSGNLVSVNGLAFDETAQGNCDDLQITFNPDSQGLAEYPMFHLLVSLTDENNAELQRLVREFTVR